MAFFTLVKASSFTLVARVAKRGLLNFFETAVRREEAWSRRSIAASTVTVALVWAKLKVRENKSCASSELRTERALDTASISRARVLLRSSHSVSVMEHFSFRFM